MELCGEQEGVAVGIPTMVRSCTVGMRVSEAISLALASRFDDAVRTGMALTGTILSIGGASLGN
jgi:hypothetical protein